MVGFMPARLKLSPAIAGTITTAVGPLYVDKPQIATVFQVTERTIDYWRVKGFLPYLRIGGTIRFDLEQCREAIEKRFSHHEPGELWAPGRAGRKGPRKKKTAL